MSRQNEFELMIESRTEIRVRYAETDQMGVVYHGNYAAYFEAARGDLVRLCGLSYRDMEAKGIMMPITEMRMKFLRPARYDDLITVVARVEKMPGRRMEIVQEVLGEKGKLLVAGAVELAFFDKNQGKTVPAPPFFLDLLEKHWPSETSEKD